LPLFQNVRTGFGSTPTLMKWVPGVHSLGVKRTKRKADHSLLSGTEIKNDFAVSDTPTQVHGVHRDNYLLLRFKTLHIRVHLIKVLRIIFQPTALNWIPVDSNRKLFTSLELSYGIIFTAINLLSLKIDSRFGHTEVLTFDVTLEGEGGQ
jgi:hypothetical protein